MKRIRILVADDHAVVRQGFKMILDAQADMEIVGEAGNGREAVELAEQLHPDVVVMDVSMPELNGIEATRRLATSVPRARVVALSMHKDSVYVREILRAGARGYLLKDSGAADLVAAIRAVASGESYLSPAVSNAVLDDYRKHATNPIDLLTSREREVLQLLAEGKTNKEIAGVLNLSVYTVEAHRGRIMEKLNLHSIGELVLFAVRNGLIESAPGRPGAYRSLHASAKPSPMVTRLKATRSSAWSLRLNARMASVSAEWSLGSSILACQRTLSTAISPPGRSNTIDRS